MRNIELKARLSDYAAARQTAEQIATARLGKKHQIDTYFQCRAGRLKLRQTDGLSSQLIWYARPDQVGHRPSEYVLVPVANPESLKRALAAALGVRAVVEKHREIFLWHNVRIHLDDVKGLGQFLEFEAVVEGGADDATAERQIAELVERFEIAFDQVLAGSYGEM